MTIDHDAIAARVRQCAEHARPCDCEVDDCIHDRAYQDAPDYDELSAACLDLYDEVQRLRADKRLIIDERDNTFALMLARAEKAEAERDRLRAVLTNGVNAYDATNFMRTADMHPDECGCLRCALDAARAALKGTSE